MPVASVYPMSSIENMPLPPPLRPDEEALIEAILTWAAAERRAHGHLPDLPVRVNTAAGEVVVVCEPRAVDDGTTMRSCASATSS